ncbi:hypothetical protein EON62_01950, partial [archaeon]
YSPSRFAAKSARAAVDASAQLSFHASQTAGDDLISPAYIPDEATRGANIPEKIASKRDYLFNTVPADLRWRLHVDDVSLYSITEGSQAELQSAALLKALGAGAVITDATSCVGGNTLSFAKYFKHVHAVELSAQRAGMVAHNAHVAGVGDRVSVHHADYTHVAARIQQDAVFFDPPWGGPEYKTAKQLDMFLGTLDVAHIIAFLTSAQVGTRVPYAKMVALKAPMNYNVGGLTRALVASGASVTSSVNMRKMLFILIHAAKAPLALPAHHPCAHMHEAAKLGIDAGVPANVACAPGYFSSASSARTSDAAADGASAPVAAVGAKRPVPSPDTSRVPASKRTHDGTQ